MLNFKKKYTIIDVFAILSLLVIISLPFLWYILFHPSKDCYAEEIFYTQPKKVERILTTSGRDPTFVCRMFFHKDPRIIENYMYKHRDYSGVTPQSSLSDEQKFHNFGPDFIQKMQKIDGYENIDEDGAIQAMLQNAQKWKESKNIFFWSGEPTIPSVPGNNQCYYNSESREAYCFLFFID